MYCMSCGTQIAQGAQLCGTCGKKTRANGSAVIADKRPIAGIAVAGILGFIGVLWDIAAIFKNLYSQPTGVEADLYQAFPALQIITHFSPFLSITGNSALLIGTLMAFLRHPNGYKTVRITSYCMLLAVLGIFVASYFAVASAVPWRMLDPITKGGLIGGLVGGALGGTLQYSLILFLFKKNRRALVS